MVLYPKEIGELHDLQKLLTPLMKSGGSLYIHDVVPIMNEDNSDVVGFFVYELENGGYTYYDANTEEGRNQARRLLTTMQGVICTKEKTS